MLWNATLRFIFAQYLATTKQWQRSWMETAKRRWELECGLDILKWGFVPVS